MNTQKIPSIDLSDFLSEDEKLKAEFVESLGMAFTDIGFIAIKNHGIPEKIIEKLYQKLKEFFNLPLSDKQKYELEENGGQRGYTSFGKEHAKNSSQGDLKEFWHFGQDINKNSTNEENYPKNIYVEEIPDFLTTGIEAYKSFEKAGSTILKALALYIGLDENYFDEFVKGGNSILRPIHYPPIKNPQTNAVRAGEHEDINLITLLVGASADGLQVLNKNGEWISVTTVKDHIVVNVGDMLQRLTNGKLKSTTHRVINPVGAKVSESRYSIPFFLHPISSMKLNCLEECIVDKKNYEDITAGKYLTERLRELGLM